MKRQPAATRLHCGPGLGNAIANIHNARRAYSPMLNIVGDVEYRVAKVPHVRRVTVDLVFDPPWSRDMMSDEAKLETGLFY